METDPKSDGYVVANVVRCKFYCQSMKKVLEGFKDNRKFMYEYEFFAVYSGSKENELYFAHTPSGSLKVAAFKDDLFSPGSEYYLDIRPVLAIE